MRHSNRRISLPGFVISAVLIFLFAGATAVQGRQSNPLPRVGTIKDYPATGLMTGCGNLYVHKASEKELSDTNYVFLSRGDGSDAWMNLNGRDVRLRQIKFSRGKQKSPRAYRYGRTLITVTIEDFAPNDAAGESDPMFKMKITLRRGRARKVVHAAGSADC